MPTNNFIKENRNNINSKQIDKINDILSNQIKIINKNRNNLKRFNSYENFNNISNPYMFEENFSYIQNNTKNFSMNNNNLITKNNSIK